MIELIRNKSNTKKKNYNEYNEMLKLFAREVKKVPLEDIVRIDTFFKEEMFCKLGKIALLFYNYENGDSLSVIKKELRKIYKIDKNALECVLLVSLMITNSIIENTRVENVYNVNLDNFISHKTGDSLNCHYNIQRLIVNILLVSMILEYDLLNHRIDYFRENNNSLQLVRKLKKDETSIIYNDKYKIITLLSSDETKVLFQCLGDNNSDIKKSFVSEVLFLQFYNELLSKVSNKDSYIKMSNSHSTIYSGMEVKSLPAKFLRGRKFLPPKNGVVIKMKNHKNIESIYFNEVNSTVGRVLTGVVRYADKEEFVFSINLSSECLHTISYRHATDIISILFDFYNIEWEECSGRITSDDYEVLSPYYWKYRNNNYETDNERESRLSGKKIEREHIIKVSSFVRKIKGNPSKEALSLAKELCIELEPNTTIVKEHIRTYHVE